MSPRKSWKGKQAGRKFSPAGTVVTRKVTRKESPENLIDRFFAIERLRRSGKKH